MADHKKIFENIDINSLDDGTFTIRVRPVEKPRKDGDDNHISSFERSKEMSASGVKNLMEKLTKIIGKVEEMEEEENEEDPLDAFMSAHEGDANSD